MKKLQVKLQKLPGSKVKLTITIEKEEMQGYERHAYRHLVNQVKIAGFRPGKAPLNILKKEVGEAKFENEVLEVAVPQSYYKAVTDEIIQAISQPQVKVVKFVPGELLEYEAEVAVLPEVKLPNYKNIKVKIGEVKVKKEEIDQILNNLRKERAILRDVEREAKKNDRGQKSIRLLSEKVILFRALKKNLLGLKKETQRNLILSFRKIIT